MKGFFVRSKLLKQRRQVPSFVKSLLVYKFFYNKMIINSFVKKLVFFYRRFFFTYSFYKRIFWLFWGFFIYQMHVRELFKSCFNFLLDKYNLNLFQQDLKNVSIVTYRKRLLNFWRISLKLSSLFYSKINYGAVIVRATINNFFLTFLRPGSRGEVGLYVSAGRIERGISKKRRSVYVAIRASQTFLQEIRFFYSKIYFLYVFFNGRLCKRTMGFLKVLSKFPFFIKNMFLVKNMSHNGLRPSKRRRLKKFN